METRKCFNYNLQLRYEKDFFIIEANEYKLINYHLEMILNNKLKTILPCNIYFKNNLPSFYYKVEDFNTFRNIMISENFKSSTFKKLLVDINNLTNELNNYLLNKKYVLLDLDLIFYSKVSDSFAFLYLPIISEIQSNDVFEEFVQKIFYILVNMYPDLINELKDILSNSIYYSIIESINKVDIEFQNALKENTSKHCFDSVLEVESESDSELGLGLGLELEPELELESELDLDFKTDFIPELGLFTGSDSDSEFHFHSPNKSAQKMKSVFKHSSFNMKDKTSSVTINMNTEVLGITLKSIFILLASQIALLIFYLIFTAFLNKISTSNVLVEFPNYILVFAECLLLVSTFFYIKKIKATQNTKHHIKDNDITKDNDIAKENINYSSISDVDIIDTNDKDMLSIINDRVDVVEDCSLDEKIHFRNDVFLESCKCEINVFAVLFKKNDNSIIEFPITKDNFVISSISKITDLFISPKNNELILTSIYVKYGSCFIEDSHSTSGTYLNGSLLTAGISHKLNDNDDITISDEHFTFQYKV